MKKLLLISLLATLSSCANSLTDQLGLTKPEMIQPGVAYTFDCKNGAANCDTVFVVGDSISIGYLPSLSQKIGQTNNVYHPLENCRNSWYTLQHVDQWIAQVQSPKTIIWNNGIWNVVRDELSNQPGQIKEQYGTTLEQYESDMRAIGAKLKATGARVIFFTTTALDSSKTENYFDTQKINQLNDIALRIMPEMGIEIYDLNAVSLTVQDQLVDGIHYNSKGYDTLSDFIVSKLNQ